MVVNDLSKTFYVANVLATILVVSIHYHTKDFIPPLTVNANYWIQEFLTNGAARVAVPVFALISGFLFFCKYNGISDYGTNLKKRVHTIIIPFILCNLIVYVSEVGYVFFKTGEWAWGELDYSLYVIFLSPIAIQLWFIRDLILLFVISPVLFFFIRKSGIFFLGILSFIWLIDLELLPLLGGKYLISVETMTYFSIGAYLAQYQNNFINVLSQFRRDILFILIVLYISLLVIRIYIDPFHLNWYYDRYTIYSLIIQNMSILIGVFLILLLSYNLRENKRLLSLSVFTFFVYLYHLYPLSRVVNKTADMFLIDQYKFYLTVPLSLIITFGLAVFLSKYLPSLYGLLVGGRNCK